ncbi:sodium:proton antiporter [Vitreoscilla sp. C1]|uniref:Na+/H+ antiporter NhaC family protein n=1 Tax=Vitreoscilla sp. (strain C1) TaxID=96942 RepID=UPI000CDBB2B2|nr:Na+/H+ antiporter NhaC family protein [Vitreoscilla sp. C1]AUZ04036.1 sodium:proton antiporter [Vitreoscilla sp. C1]
MMWFRNVNVAAIDNKLLLTVVAVILVLIGGVYALAPVDVEGKRIFGIFTLIPVLSVLALALISKRTLEPLCAGAIIGLLMLDVNPLAFINGLMGSSLKVLASPVMGWIMLLSALMGGLIMWLQVSRATVVFSDLLEKYVKTRPQSMFAAWILGLIIFVDDYLSVLTVGAATRRLTDKFGVSRAMLAYIAAATAAPLCLLVPLSTWAIYVSGLLEANNAVAAGEGLKFYISVIPYIFYAWSAVFLVPLVIYNLIPMSPAMRRAEMAAKTNPPVQTNVEELEGSAKPALWHFFLPIIVMIVLTWYLGDTLLGVMGATIVTLVAYRMAGLGSIPALCEHFMKGVSSMVTPIAIIFAAFVLQDVNEQLGLAPYIIESAKPLISANLLPVITFVLLAFLTFTTGSFWGIYAISIPIIVPLAQALDANMALTLGALISAGGFGSHACFFGDSTVLESRGCEITPIEHALTQLRYVMISAAIAAVLFAVMPFIMA